MAEAFFVAISPHDATGPVTFTAGAQTMMTAPELLQTGDRVLGAGVLPEGNRSGVGRARRVLLRVRSPRFGARASWRLPGSGHSVL